MPLYAGQKPSFKALLAANQTGIADSVTTKLAFATEVYDIGGFYDAVTNYRWTPPAGPVALSLSAAIVGTFAVGANVQLEIYKNGAAFYRCAPRYAPIVDETEATGVITDNANGTDYYEAFVFANVTSGTATAAAGVAQSQFMGWML